MKKLEIIKNAVLILLIFTVKVTSQSLSWARSFGGTNSETSGVIVSENTGDLYIAGTFMDTVDFDPGPSVYNMISANGKDAFILKLDSAGSFIWVKTISGSGSQSITNLITTNSNELLISMYSEMTADFDPGVSVYSITSFGDFDAFILKLDTQGNFIWVKQIGGEQGDSPGLIDCDLFDNVYLTGSFQDTVDFDPGVGVFNLVAATGGRDIFVTKLDATGNLLWAKQLGGSGPYQDGTGLDIDNNGNVYVSGRFNLTIDLDPGPGTFNLTTATPFVNDMDAFICKLDAGGNFIWGKQFGSTLEEFISDLNLDGTGNLYSTGFFQQTIDFDPAAGVHNLTSAGGWDCFILKLDTAGNFVWANRIGGTSNDFSRISIDNFGYIYVSGFFHGNIDFDPGPSVYNMSTTTLYSKVFVTKWDAQANFIWAINMGGDSNNGISQMVFDGVNNMYATGVFDQTMNCDPSGGVYNVTSNGLYDVNVLKLVQPPVGIFDFNISAQELSLAPNPAVDYVSIEAKSKIKSARLLTVTGSVVMEQANVNATKVIFDVSSLPAGIYFAEVVTTKGRVYKKWLKE